MSDAIASHTPTQWYILRYIKPDTIRLKQPIAGTINQFNRTENTSLELFAPTIIRVVHREGKLIKVESPLAYQYIFLRGDIQPIRKLCCLNCGFSLVLNHGSSEKYARLTDEQMNMFRQIATAYRNRLPFFAINDIDLQQGDKVEILEGSFPGLIGYYIPKPKSASGNIVLAVTQSLGTIIYDVKAKYVRVLEFAKNSKRSYDQIDAFIPKLLKSLRDYAAGTPLTCKSISELTIFCRRMDQVKLDNPKLEAKLMAILACAYIILGDTEGYQSATDRFERRKTAITSPSTLSLIHLLKAVTTNSPTLFAQGLDLLTHSTPEEKSKTLHLLHEEYNYYQSKFLWNKQ